MDRLLTPSLKHMVVEVQLQSSLLTEWVKGKTIDEAMHSKYRHSKELALPPVKIHCSVLAEDAIKGAIDDYRKKNGIVR